MSFVAITAAAVKCDMCDRRGLSSEDADQAEMFARTRGIQRSNTGSGKHICDECRGVVAKGEKK